ncbi:MAG: crossover junction endodeoxyribonuclease RuvC [Candidatus Omnitrophica bacterium]|nr:crossover junction endodeoxyribonuclease RuvC [Candidatus Omnitrophota bacterium]
MRILGVDPGLKATGYGMVEFEAGRIRLLETGTIEPRQKDFIQNRIKTIYVSLNEVVDQHRPDVLVLEKLYAHYNHPTTASILGHVRGVICLVCAQKDVGLVEHSVKRIRQALTGNGSASKLQVRRVVGQALGVDENKLTLDASVALALALGYIHLHCRRI